MLTRRNGLVILATARTIHPTHLDDLLGFILEEDMDGIVGGTRSWNRSPLECDYGRVGRILLPLAHDFYASVGSIDANGFPIALVVLSTKLKRGFVNPARLQTQIGRLILRVC